MFQDESNKLHSCSTCKAACAGTLKWLNQQETLTLDQNREHKSFQANDVIFREGELTQGYFCIQSGFVKIYQTFLESERPKLVRIAGAGNVLGYGNFNSPPTMNDKHPFTAKCVNEVKGCFLATEQLKSLDNSVNMMRGLANDYFLEAKQIQKNMLNLLQRTIRERLAFILLDLETQHGRPHKMGTLVDLDLSRSDLADLCGTVIESISRTLSDFQNEKLIHLKGRKIIITDRNGLQNLS